MAHDVLDLPRSERIVHDHGDRAGSEHTEERACRRRSSRREDRNAIGGGDLEPRQQRRDLSSMRSELGIRRFAVTFDDRRCVLVGRSPQGHREVLGPSHAFVQLGTFAR